MMSRCLNPEFRTRQASSTRARFWFFVLFLLASFGAGHADNVILHLKNGDRVAGVIVSEDTNRVVITTTWIQNLGVPLSEIVSREAVPAPAAVAGAVTNLPAANAPAASETKQAPAVAAAPAASATNPPAGAVQPAAPRALATNAPVAVRTSAPPALAASAPVPKPRTLKAEVKVGADFLFAARDQEIYYGRFKLTYEHPYASNPRQFFRNILDYALDYGRTDGVLSANRMTGADKMDFDLSNHGLYTYNQGAVGYDEVRRIDFQWEAGPGLGYHLLRLTRLAMNLEAGINYWSQQRADNTRTEKFYFRLAEDATWKIAKRLTFTEKVEFFPQVVDVTEYRSRIESTLSYGIWQNVSLNVSLLNLYDTQPAKGVPNNDLQVRSSLGFTF